MKLANAALAVGVSRTLSALPLGAAHAQFYPSKTVRIINAFAPGGPSGLLSRTIADKWVMDDWGQAKAGPFGALRAHVDSGRLNEQNLHAELGQIVAGLKPGRESDDETILFWHRGLSLSDIALGAAMLAKAERMGIGQMLRYR